MSAQHTRDKHETIMQDQNSTSLAVLALAGTSLGQAYLGGGAISNGVVGWSPAAASGLGYVAIASAAVLVWMAYRVSKGDEKCAFVGAGLLAAIGLGALAAQSLPLSIALFVGSFLNYRGALALARTHEILHKAQQEPPKIAYHRHLLSVLVKVMGIDGHFDQRERNLLRQVARESGVSGVQQRLLMQDAIQASKNPVGMLISDFLESAEAAQIAQPKQTLLRHVCDVIAADGLLVPEEAHIFVELGLAMDAPRTQLEKTLQELQQEITQLTPTQACQLLEVPAQITREQLDKAYTKLVQSLTEQPSNEGKPPRCRESLIASYMERRMKVLQQAYLTLRQKLS